MMELYITRAEDLVSKYSQAGGLGGAWQGVKNWFSGEGNQQPQTGQNPQQISQQLRQAWTQFRQLHNQQIQQLNPAMKSIKQVMDGMVSQQGAQAMQMQPGVQSQITQLIQSLQQAVSEENKDVQMIATIVQSADDIAQAFGGIPPATPVQTAPIAAPAPAPAPAPAGAGDIPLRMKRTRKQTTGPQVEMPSGMGGAGIAAKTDIPILTAERGFSKHIFRNII